MTKAKSGVLQAPVKPQFSAYVIEAKKIAAQQSCKKVRREVTRVIAGDLEQLELEPAVWFGVSIGVLQAARLVEVLGQAGVGLGYAGLLDLAKELEELGLAYRPDEDLNEAIKERKERNNGKNGN